MRTMKDTCLVEVSGPSRDLNGSCSGIMIDKQNGYIVTHASILLAFLLKDSRTFNALQTKQALSSKWFQNMEVTAMLQYQDSEQDKKEKKSKLQKLQKYATALIQVNVSSKKQDLGLLPKFSGEVQLVWKATNFATTVKKLFSTSEDWKFYDDPASPASKTIKTVEKKQDIDNDALKLAKLLPFFVLIKLNNWTGRQNSPIITSSKQLHVGDTLYAVGTPFSNLSPEVFLNSTSKGTACQVTGRTNETILTDARCIPGSEGGAIYLQDRKSIVGIIAAPLCWKASEWIGLSIVCGMAEVRHSLSDTLNNMGINLHLIDSGKPALGSPAGHSVSHLVRSTPVVMVHNGSSWGSGIICHHGYGLVLTCSHVVKASRNVSVRLEQPQQQWLQAKVLYASPPDKIFDIALLQIDNYRAPFDSYLHDVMPLEDLEEGVSVYMVGHPLFGQSHNLAPTVTQGVISKVTNVKDVPVLVQSSCVVQAGASGGPLVTEHGQLVGIVTCNARDTESGACFPHVNLAIPAATIWPVLQQYINAQDPKILECLHIRNDLIEKLWSLRSIKEEIEPVMSKL